MIKYENSIVIAVKWAQYDDPSLLFLFKFQLYTNIRDKFIYKLRLLRISVDACAQKIESQRLNKQTLTFNKHTDNCWILKIHKIIINVIFIVQMKCFTHEIDITTQHSI